MRCDKCNGTGQLPDSKKLGKEFRQLRKQHRVPLQQIATAMGFTRSYLSELELGNRTWTDSLAMQYKLALSKEINR